MPGSIARSWGQRCRSWGPGPGTARRCTSAPSPITRLMPGPSSLKGITCTWNQVVRGGWVHLSSGPMDEASPGGGCVSMRAGIGDWPSRTKVERWSMVTTSLPCSTCAGSTTMPLGVTTPTARLFRSPPAARQLFRRWVNLDSQRLAQDERGCRSDVDGQGQEGSAAGRYLRRSVLRCSPRRSRALARPLQWAGSSRRCRLAGLRRR